MNPIEVTHLSHRYGRVEAVHDLSFSVPAGSITAMVGPNGAGKSTTLRVLAGLIHPRGGFASVNGVDSRRLRVADKARIGFLDERQPQPEWMKVRQFLDYCRPFYPSWDRGLEAELLSRFALPVDTRLDALSRGMRMKALLVAATAFRPTVLLLDEPFSGFDPVVRDDVSRGLIEVTQAGECTVLLSSHDIEEVERVADRLIMLEAGRLVVSDEIAGLQARFRKIEIELGDDAQGAGRSSEAAGLSDGWPAHWSIAEEQSGRLEFVDSAFDHVHCEAECRRRFSEATVRARPMALRDIYLQISRTRSNKAFSL